MFWLLSDVDEGSAWASLLEEDKDWIIGPGGNLLANWWVYLPVTLAIIAFGFAWNLLGDELNSAINPRETAGKKKNQHPRCRH